MRTNKLALVVPAALALTFIAGCGTGTGDAGADQGKKAAASATPSVASNGVDELAAAEIMSRARKATAGAPSVRLTGRFKEGGDDLGLDFRFAGRKKAAGTVQMGNQHIKLTRIGSTVYFKGNDAFLRSIGDKNAVTLMSGKYVKTTSKDPDFAEIASFSNLSGLLGELLSAKGSDWDKGKAGTVAGKPTVTLSGPDGEQVHVATQGQPYLLQIDAGPQGSLDFVSYGEPVAVEAPPANTVLDLGSMQ
ncbi:hypothetical protein [Actinomadura sp. 9N407]|uniref:hypothetical protein n=1 Tax=Actinomadura sp. 9N407 TaxID=3375154 RepID=UPI00379E9DD0